PDADGGLVVSAQERAALIRNEMQIARKLQIDAEKNPAKGGAEDTINEARAEPRRQARLALAGLGNAAAHGQALGDKRHLNREIPDDELGAIGQQTAKRLIGLGETCQQRTEYAQTPSTPLAEARKALYEAAALARHLDGWAASGRLGNGPVTLARW